LATADVTVRGAGIFGLAIAYVCLQRGARVQVIDPGGPGAGASGGVVGALAPHVPDNWNPKKAFQLDCLAGAKGRWAQVESVSGISPGYARTGRLQTLTDDRAAALARGRQAEAARNWGDRFVWEIIEAATVRAWAPQSPSGLLLRDSLSARIHPRRACESLAGAIRTLGGGVLPDATDEGIVIHATGWDGLVELNEALGVTVGGGVKGQAVLLRHVAPGGAPQIFAEGLHIIPHADGTVAVGSTSERDFDDPTLTDDQGDRLLETALARMPILHGATCIARWAGVRPRARSRAPILGAWPGRDSHFVANGGFKIGFGIAWGVADLMADLVLDGRNAIPEMFRIESNL
jgi:glycine oxidase